MMKECVVLDGKVINIGPWDYQYTTVEIEPAEFDEDGNVTKEGVYEEKAMNPLPEGAVIEERDFEYDEDRGWYEVGIEPPKTKLEILEESQLDLWDLILFGGDDL